MDAVYLCAHNLSFVALEQLIVVNDGLHGLSVKLVVVGKFQPV